jgi:hypothetical protein
VSEYAELEAPVAQAFPVEVHGRGGLVGGECDHLHRQQRAKGEKRDCNLCGQQTDPANILERCFI